MGMVGILGGLVFVGLEMRLNQRIALAARHQARSEMWMDQINAHTEAGIAYRNYTAKEAYAQSNSRHAISVIFENDYIQYELGLMDEGLWEKKKVVIKRVSGNCEMEGIWPEDLPQEFMALVEEGSKNCS